MDDEFPLNWGPDDEKESTEDVQAALARVRKEGSKKKAVRRSAVGGTLAVLLIAGVAVYGALASGNSSNSNLASPSSTALSTQAPTTALNITLASQVIANASTAYGNAKNVSGTSTMAQYCLSDQQGCEQQSTINEFKFRENGDAWLHVQTLLNNKVADEDFESFTASNFQTLQYSAKGRYESFKPSASINSFDQPFGQFDYQSFGHFSLTSLLNGLSADKNASLSTVQVDGHDAWQIHAKGLGIDSLGYSPDEVIAVFDKSTYFPLEVHELRKGEKFMDVAVNNLNRDAQFTNADFTIDTHGLKATTYSQTPVYQTVASPDKLAALTLYKPLVAKYQPDGFSLASIQFSKDQGAGGPEGLNLYNKDVVIMTYRRGLQSVVVTTRQVGPKPTEWNDPLGREGQQNAGDTEFVVKGGAYNGTKAKLVTGFGVTPHVWIIGATTLTTISGDTSADQLQQMLGSLQS